MPPSCSHQAGFRGTVSERAVARVVEEAHVLSGIGRRDGQIEPAVVVEIFHHRAAGRIESINADRVADIPKLADVELGIEIMVQPDQVAGVDLVRVLTQGHVSHVQDPANAQVVGKVGRDSR